MKKYFFFAVLMSCFLLNQVQAQYKDNPAIKGAIYQGILTDTCYHSHTVSIAQIQNTNPRVQRFIELYKNSPNEARAFKNSLATSKIIINFSSNFESDPAARDAFRFAADMWELEVISSVPIVIDADYRDMGTGVIGSNSSRIVNNVPNSPDPSMSYVASLGNSIAGVDLLPGLADMVQSYNSSFNFYYGTDLNTPSNLTDFVSIAFHEIGHGMGITGSSNGGVGVGNGQGGRPYPWDTFVERGDGSNLLNQGFGTAEQVAGLTSNDLFINSYNAKKALNGVRPKIFAPATFSAGSSFSHWDEATFRAGNVNSLMTPQIGSGEAIHDLGPITRGVLRDMGWVMAKKDPFDIGLEQVIQPVSGINLGTENITVVVGNLGINDLSNLPISYRVDNGPWIEEVINTVILPGELVEHTFSTPADFSEPGRTYFITAKIDLFIDGFVDNNIVEKNVTHLQSINTFPYSESFEGGPSGWIAEGDNIWELGTPNGSIINSASDGDNAWVTVLAGNYPTNATAFVLSPIFDFTSLADPEIEFDIWYEIETGWDGAALQTSFDNGVTWNTVGKFGDPNNWYNDGPDNPPAPGQGDAGIDALTAALGNGNGWTGFEGAGSGGYVTAKRIIEGAGNQSQVIFRIAFASDNAVNAEGMAFDNVRITADQLRDFDAGIVNIISPASGNLSGVETLEVEVRNFGTQTISNFPIGYTFNGGPPVVESFDGSINPGTTVTFAFNQTLDLSVGGNYLINVFTDLVNDENPANDGKLSEIESVFSFATFPYSQDFEGGAGGWVTGGTNSSWELGTPSNTIINQASSGNQAWVTNLNGNYNSGENSFLLSPGFDFSGLQNITMAFDIWFETEELADGVVFQYSTDNGISWQLPSPDFVINWNSVPNVTVFSQPGWSGASGGYRTAYIHLSPDLEGSDLVRFRLQFGSNGSIESEGIAIDNIRLFDREAIIFSLECPIVAQVGNDPGLSSAFLNPGNPVITGNTGGAPIFTNSFNFDEDPSANYPIGSTSITYLVDIDGEVKFCTTIISVVDVDPPVIDCPDEIIVAIPSGQTEVVVNYDPPLATDNFGFEREYTYSTDQSVSNTGIACPTGPNRYIRPFKLPQDFGETGDFSLDRVDFGVQLVTAEAGEIPGTVNIYAFEEGNEFIFSNFELISSIEIGIPNGSDGTILSFPISGVIPAGKTAVVELFVLAGGAAGAPNRFFPGANPDQTGTSYILASGCSIDQPLNVEDIDFPDAQWVMNINGFSGSAAPTQFVSGIGSGNSFPLGSNTEIFTLSDVEGNMAECEFDVNVITATLDAPEAFDPTGISGIGFTAEWSAVGGVDGYELFIIESGFNSPLIDYSGLFVTGNTRVVTGLKPNVAYSVRVRSRNMDPAEYSEYSNTILVSTSIDAPVLSEFSNVTSNSFTVTWSAVENIDEYALEISVDNFSTFLEGFDPLLINATNVQIDDLESNTEYFARVRSVNDAGQSANSNVISIMTPPSTPKALPPTVITENSIEARWESVPQAATYELEVTTNNFVDLLAGYDPVIVMENTSLISGLNPNLDYQYRVRAVNATNVKSSNSNQIRSTTLAATPVALNPSEISSYGATLEWLGSPNVLSYEVDVSPDDFGSFVPGAQGLTADETNKLVLGLSEETNYEFRVRAINRKGVVGTNSNSVSFETLGSGLSGLDAPIAFSAEDLTTTSLLASWGSVENAIFYEFEFGTDFTNNFTSLTTTNTERFVGSLTNNTGYRYRVRAGNNIGLSAYSNIIDISTITSLWGNVNEGLLVYPVPTLSNLNIELNNDWVGPVDLLITDNLGRVVYQSLTQKSGESLQMNINISEFSKGLYYIRVLSGEEFITRRIIKN